VSARVRVHVRRGETERSRDVTDVEFESDFLYSYRDFTNPADFFECLTQRFNSVGPMTHPDTFVIVRKRCVALPSARRACVCAEADLGSVCSCA
jgi:hypothetical protein